MHVPDKLNLVDIDTVIQDHIREEGGDASKVDYLCCST